MVMILYIITLCLVIVYSAYMNFLLCDSKEVLRKELHQAQADLAKLKMLNKLKVDWDGNPIRSQSVDEAFDKVMERYRGAVEELSKND